MKQAVTGYITAMINNYNNRIDRVPENNVNLRNMHQSFLMDLYDLLDFVEDMPEKMMV